MSVKIVQQGEFWVIPCREFAAVQLGRNIRFRYRTKANATRAVLNGKYNLLTNLCFNLEQLYTRLTMCENLLFKIKTHTSHFTEDVWWIGGHNSDIESDGFLSGSVNSGPGSGAEGTAATVGFSTEGTTGADGGDEGSD